MSRQRVPPACWLLCIVCALASLAYALTSCSVLPGTAEIAEPTASPESTPEPEPTDTPLPPGTAALVLWEPFPLDRPQGLLLGEMVRDFQAENPDVQIEVVPKDGYLGIHDGMLAELPGGELPDVAVAFPSMIAQYAASGVVVDLGPFLADSEIGLTAEDLADVYPNLMQAGRIPGLDAQTLSFPFVQNAVGLWVNRTLLAAAGWQQAPATWQEFEQACFDVWAYTGVRCLPYVESVTTFNAWLYSRGGQQLDDSGTRATFNQPAGVEGLALLRRLIDAGLAWLPQDPYGDYVAFGNGEAAFAFSSTGNRKLYTDAYAGALERGMAPFEWDQTLIPQADPEQPATALYGTSFFVVRSTPEQERAAWRLIRWFTAKEQTARWAGQMEAMPVRASALTVMTATLQADPFLRAQVETILPYGRPEPAVAAELDVRDVLYTAIVSVTHGYSDTQAALDQAAREVDALLGGGP
jgi:ABC-type glycerol-3-phosphate transport system substrate-binding protein